MRIYLASILLLLSSCASFKPTARAPRRARHTYHHAQRYHARHRASPAPIYWN